MDNIRAMLADVTDLELAVEIGPNKRINLKCELFEIVTDTKFAVSVPIHNGQRYPLAVGLKMQVYFKKEDLGVCHFSGMVVSRHSTGSPPLLFIQLLSAVDKDQRRNYFRLPLLTDVILKIPAGITIEKQMDRGKIIEVEIVDYKKIPVITKDISGGGLRAIVGERLELGLKLQIIIVLEKDRVEVPAEVVRCQLSDPIVKRYDCGIRFLEMEEKDRSKIVAFVFEKQRNLRKKGLV